MHIQSTPPKCRRIIAVSYIVHVYLNTYTCTFIATTYMMYMQLYIYMYKTQLTVGAYKMTYVCMHLHNVSVKLNTRSRFFLNIHVAVYLHPSIPLPMQPGSSSILMLAREVEVLKRLDHPHIIRLEEVLETTKVRMQKSRSRTYVLYMEYMY